MGNAGETVGPGGGAPLRLRLLGRLALSRGGEEVALPASRKVRALLGYLAMAGAPVPRSRLCELLWDVPNDPRGELRWSLSKLRGLVDAPGCRRVEATGDTVRLDLSGCAVDAAEVAAALEGGAAMPGLDGARALAARFAGDFLEGLELERCPALSAWLAAERRRFRDLRAALLARLAAEATGAEAQAHLSAWLALEPFELRAHRLLLEGLARQGHVREGAEHLAAATRAFEAEGLDPAPLREAWRAARAVGITPARLSAAACVLPVAVAGAPGGAGPGLARPAGRAAIAVMPFADRTGEPGGHGGLAIAEDLTTRLAKLRSLFVIAQGTMRALRERQVGPDEAGRLLGADYVVGGSLRRRAGRLEVVAELVDARTAQVAWSDCYAPTEADTLPALEEIGDRIVAAVAAEAEAAERNRAVLRPPASLDAWGAYHRGLWHAYRFNRADNERARQLFERATCLDPTFARGHAGLSFAHFQNAFQGWGDRAAEMDLAFDAAGQGLMADDRDPAAHWAMGRALWLRGEHDQSVDELVRSVALSPNYAQGHYALAFVQSQAGPPDEAIAFADQSRLLSPFDPLLFAMLASRCVALVRLGRFEEAADWGVKAASRPNAHAQILAIAAFSLALAGRTEEGRALAGKIHARLPRYGLEDFLTAMRFSPDGARLFREGARRIGMG